MERKKGFTLIELLVVIAIIALLLSIITPALNQVKDRARRIMCGNALRQWGIAISAHTSANNYLAKTVMRWGETPYPHYFAAVPNYDGVPNYMDPEEFSVYEMAPYIDCVTKDFYQTGSASKILTCPSAGGDFIVDWCYATWHEFCAPDGIRSGPPEYFIEPAYSYWVIGGMDPPLDASDIGAETGDASANVYRDLTVDVLSPKRLLMTEILNLDFSDPPVYRYNHGRKGWSWNEDHWEGTGYGPTAGHQDYEEDGGMATGRSQLFGDGRVEWRAISVKTDDNLPSDYTGGRYEDEWNGPGSGWVATNDTDYY
jgi:prepilin-type N-terminal cleavage/methylation domain-containing protein